MIKLFMLCCLYFLPPTVLEKRVSYEKITCIELRHVNSVYVADVYTTKCVHRYYDPEESYYYFSDSKRDDFCMSVVGTQYASLAAQLDQTLAHDDFPHPFNQ